MDSVAGLLVDLECEADDDDDEKLFDSVFSVEPEVRAIQEASSEFRRWRISWKDFGMIVEKYVDSLEGELEDIDEHHPKVKPLLKQAVELARPILAALDSGNRKAAEEYANRKAGRT